MNCYLKPLFGVISQICLLLTLSGGGASAATATVNFEGRVFKTTGGFGMGPDKAQTSTLLNKGAVRFEVINAGKKRMVINLESVNADKTPAPDIALPSQVRLAPGERRTLVALIPLHGQAQRTLQICATVSGKRSCGEYRVRRR